MRWKKANRNKRRRLARERAATSRPLFTPGWQEWLDKMLPRIVPGILHKDSIFARLVNRRPELLASRKFTLPIKGFPIWAEPDPRTSGAFQGPSRYFMIVDDDIDFSKPCRPQPAKTFIYGDNWVAYKRIRPEV